MAAGGKEMEIAIKIAGKVENSFKSALSAATKGIGNIAKAVSAATTAAAAAVGAIGIAAVNVGKEFETAMSQVAATMLIDKTTEEGQKAFETLENAARECGRSTAFSAGEAAEALNNLAMAGYDATSAATALPTVLNLAGAGGLELADSARYITASLAALGLEKTENNFNHFADILAITASKAKTDVSQLGDAITTLGGTGKGLAGGTEEIAALLGILADADITSSEGGTHLRNLILSLQNPRNAEAAKMFKQLGIEAYDSEGKMRGLNEIFGDISASMEGMTDQQKNDVMSTIFKQTDLAAANALLADCGERFNELYDAAANSSEGIGAAAEMYKRQCDNLQGDIDTLKSGLSDLGISIYKELQGPLRGITQLGTEMVGELATAYSEGGMQGMVGAVGGCLSEAVNVMSEYAPQVINMGVDLLSNFIGGIEQNSGEVANAAEGILFAFAEGVFTLVPQVVSAGIHIGTNFANGIGANAPMLISTAAQMIGNFVIGITQTLPQLLGVGIQLILNLVQGVISNIPLILQIAVQVVTNFVMGINQMLPMIIQGGIQLIVNLLQGIIQNLPVILQAAAQIVITLITGIIQALPSINSAGQQLLHAIKETLINTDWPQVGKDIINGIINGVMSAGSGLLGAVKGLFTGKEAEVDMSSSGAEATKSYVAGIQNNVSSATSALSTTAFSNMDYTGITAAGMAAGNAFSSGLSGDSQAVTMAATNLGSGVNMALDGEWQKTESSAQMSMQKITQTVTSEAQAAAQAIKSAFENMTITIPKPKIPVISVSSNAVSYGDGGSVNIPEFSVNWNALGGIFDKPTVFNTSSGLQGAGEAGPEALLPLDTLWSKMKEIVSQAVMANSGGSMVDALVSKLQGIGGGSNNGNTSEFAGTGGMTIHWNPTYNLYGSAGKEEIVEANGITQADFDRHMKQWERENRRKSL